MSPVHFESEHISLVSRLVFQLWESCRCGLSSLRLRKGYLKRKKHQAPKGGHYVSVFSLKEVSSVGTWGTGTAG